MKKFDFDDFDDRDLDDVTRVASIALQNIQKHCGRKNVPKARVKFPRGFIRTREEIEEEVPNIDDKILVRNICYSLIMVDVLRWLMVRTNIDHAAASMICKEMICIYGSICESLIQEVLGKEYDSFKKGSDWLVKKNVIDVDLKSKIDWIWDDMRKNEHLYLVKELEYDKYKRRDVDRAREAYNKFCEKLNDHLSSSPETE